MASSGYTTGAGVETRLVEPGSGSSSATASCAVSVPCAQCSTPSFYRKNLMQLAATIGVPLDSPMRKSEVIEKKTSKILCFFNSIGYSCDDATRLVEDIVKGTDAKTLKFSKLSNYGPMVLAKTMLNGEIVTSVYKLQHNFDLKLVTLIPGGDKKWLSK